MRWLSAVGESDSCYCDPVSGSCLPIVISGDLLELGRNVKKCKLTNSQAVEINGHKDKFTFGSVSRVLGEGDEAYCDENGNLLNFVDAVGFSNGSQVLRDYTEINWNSGCTELAKRPTSWNRETHEECNSDYSVKFILDFMRNFKNLLEHDERELLSSKENSVIIQNLCGKVFTENNDLFYFCKIVR